MAFSFSFTLPFLGDVYVDLVAKEALAGRVFQNQFYRGERFIRAAFIHAIYTPKGYKFVPLMAEKAAA